MGVIGMFHLEKPLQPPDLEDALPYKHAQLKYTPPLDPSVRALCRVPMCPFPDHDVRLLVFDLCE